MAEARISSIQTGAERAAGQSGRAHDQAFADLNARIDKAEARTQRLIAETRAGLAQTRAAVEHSRLPNQ